MDLIALSYDLHLITGSHLILLSHHCDLLHPVTWSVHQLANQPHWQSALQKERLHE